MSAALGYLELVFIGDHIQSWKHHPENSKRNKPGKQHFAHTGLARYFIQVSHFRHSDFCSLPWTWSAHSHVREFPGLENSSPTHPDGKLFNFHPKSFPSWESFSDLKFKLLCSCSLSTISTIMLFCVGWLSTVSDSLFSEFLTSELQLLGKKKMLSFLLSR